MSLSSLSPEDLAELINAVPIELNGIAPIARAISTAGGISFDELDADFMIRRLPGVFAAGEMLDWEAPTGGYLLQASFATGARRGRVLKWLSVAGARRMANDEVAYGLPCRQLRRSNRHRSFPRAATGSVPMISSPRTITTSSIMLTTTQT